jgi:hypothetical protein
MPMPLLRYAHRPSDVVNAFAKAVDDRVGKRGGGELPEQRRAATILRWLRTRTLDELDRLTDGLMPACAAIRVNDAFG